MPKRTRAIGISKVYYWQTAKGTPPVIFRGPRTPVIPPVQYLSPFPSLRLYTCIKIAQPSKFKNKGWIVEAIRSRVQHKHPVLRCLVMLIYITPAPWMKSMFNGSSRQTRHSSAAADQCANDDTARRLKSNSDLFFKTKKYRLGLNYSPCLSVLKVCIYTNASSYKSSRESTPRKNDRRVTSAAAACI